MTLSSPDSNEIGRYDETTSIGTSFSAFLNLALASVSAAFTKYVRTKTVFKRTTGTLASSTSYQTIAIGTSVIGSAFTHSSGVFTCVTAGEYRIKLNLSYAANSTGQRGARLLGSGTLGSRTIPVVSGPTSALETTSAVEWIVTLAVNDTVTAQAFQNSGSTLTVLGDILFERLV